MSPHSKLCRQYKNRMTEEQDTKMIRQEQHTSATNCIENVTKQSKCSLILLNSRLSCAFITLAKFCEIKCIYFIYLLPFTLHP